MIFITSIALVSYLILITYIILGVRKYRPERSIDKDERSNLTRFSVLIPCRNEEDRLQSLFQSIKELEYETSCFQLIFIDDHSDDATHEMINSFQKENDRLNIKVLKNDRSPGKKSALTCGIDRSEFEHIITTDADCYLPENWLISFHQHLLRKKSSMIIAPVVYQQPGNFLEQFQHDDFLSLQAITLSTAMHNKPVLCNGANLCYKKDDFYKVGGFDQHEKIPSGDDVLLMESFLQSKLDVDYIMVKTLPVITQPMRSWRQLVNQRKRWISKTGKTHNFTNFWLLFCLGIYTIGFWSLLISAFLDAFYFQEVFVLIIFKWVMDYLIFRVLAEKINILICFRKILISSIFYPLWVVYIVVKSLHRSYNWKGEKKVY